MMPRVCSTSLRESAYVDAYAPPRGVAPLAVPGRHAASCDMEAIARAAGATRGASASMRAMSCFIARVAQLAEALHVTRCLRESHVTSRVVSAIYEIVCSRVCEPRAR